MCLPIIIFLLSLVGCVSKDSQEWLDVANSQQRYQCNLMTAKSQYDECMAKIQESSEVFKHKRTDSIEEKESPMKPSHPSNTDGFIMPSNIE